ncbi:MAG: GNAT family N-acetyltransferase [Deltaproteobacteria bacterium]|nr:GNAT family N-acetyltransferase [Deltaproteobacteria bacterium]
MGFEKPHANGRPREDALLVRVRRPRPSDGNAVRALARRAEPLASGVEEALPPLLRHFADTSLVAEVEGHLVGFVGGYRPPTSLPSLLIWQLDIEPALRRQGLGSALLHALIQCPGCAGIECLEATVRSSNLAAKRLFEAFARDLEATCESITDSPSDLLESMRHEPEDILLRIGPIRIEHAMRLERPHETL